MEQRKGKLVSFWVSVVFLVIIASIVRFLFFSYPQSLEIWAKGGEYAVELQEKIDEQQEQMDALSRTIQENNSVISSQESQIREQQETLEIARNSEAQAKMDLDIISEQNSILEAKNGELEQTLSLMSDWKGKYDRLRDEKGEQWHFSIAALAAHPITARLNPEIGLQLGLGKGNWQVLAGAGINLDGIWNVRLGFGVRF